MALFMNIGIFVDGGQKHTTFLLPEISIGIPGLSKICRNVRTEARTAVKQNRITSHTARHRNS